MDTQPKTDQELIDAFAIGTTSQRFTKVVLRSKNFVVFRIPGRNFMNGQTSQYGRSSHYLKKHGDWIFRGENYGEWEGRVSKKVLQSAIEEAEMKFDKLKQENQWSQRASHYGLS